MNVRIVPYLSKLMEKPITRYALWLLDQNGLPVDKIQEDFATQQDAIDAAVVYKNEILGKELDLDLTKDIGNA